MRILVVEVLRCGALTAFSVIYRLWKGWERPNHLLVHPGLLSPTGVLNGSSSESSIAYAGKRPGDVNLGGLWLDPAILLTLRAGAEFTKFGRSGKVRCLLFDWLFARLLSCCALSCSV